MPTAQQQLEVFFDKYDPAIAKLGRQAFAYLKKRLPGALITVYDNYNALAIGFGPAGKAAVISIALYPRWVTLFFLFGAGLPDPDDLLEGKGARVRSVRLTDGLKTLKAEPVDALISAAVLDRAWRLDTRATGELEIRAISPNQRPRRP